MQYLRLLWRDETGLELSEYAIAVALVTIPLTASITDLGSKLEEVITVLTNKIKSS